MSRPKKSPAMPLYGKDAWSDEAFLSLDWDEQGLFWRLSFWQWMEGSIPDDIDRIVEIVGKAKSTRALWGSMRRFFITHPELPGRRFNPTTERNREAFLRAREKNAKGADITNAKRRESVTLFDTDSDTLNDERAPRSATAERNASRGNAILSKEDSLDEESKSLREGSGERDSSFKAADAFEEAWNRYPGPKLGKQHAKKSFLSGKLTAVREAGDLERLTIAMDRYAAWMAEPRNSWREWQHGSTWFSNWPEWEKFQPPVPMGSDSTGHRPEESPGQMFEWMRPIVAKYLESHPVPSSGSDIRAAEKALNISWQIFASLAAQFEPDLLPLTNHGEPPKSASRSSQA